MEKSLKEKLDQMHPERSEKSWQFSFLRDSYTGLGGFGWNQPINDNTTFGRRSLANGWITTEFRPSYLDRFPLEREDSYYCRLKSTSYVNFVAPIVDLYNDLLYKRRAIRTSRSFNLIKWISENEMENLAKRAVKMAQIYGTAFVVVDAPDTMGLNNMSQLENWKGPYVTVLDPTSVLSWDVDDEGDFNFIKYKIDKVRTVDPFSDPVVISTWVIWSRESWEVWESVGDDDAVLVTSGANPFGVVPVAALKLRESMEGNYLGDSPILEVSTLTRSFYNRSSELTILLRGQAFSQLVVPQAPGAENSEFEIGPNSIIFVDPESKVAPQYISPASSNSELYEKRLNEIQNDIFRAAKLEYLRQQMTGRMQGNVSSGLSRAFSFAQANAALVGMGKACNQFEKKIAKIILGYYGEESDYEVEYPNDYELSAGAADLNNLKESIATSMPSVVLSKLRKNIAQNLVNLNQEEYVVLQKQIEEQEKIKEENTKPEKQKEDQEEEKSSDTND